jgi:hypothetical protein
MDKKFIVPAEIEATSMATQIAYAHGLSALKAKFFKVPENNGTPDDPDQILIGQTSNYLINTLVYDTVTFMGNNQDGSLSYYDLNLKQVITVPKFQIPVALCSVTNNIEVVKSKIAGRSGTIKQFINTGDYDVTIRGVFTTGVADKFPYEAMQNLQKITNCTTEVKVASNFLQIFGINYLVIESATFEQMPDKGRDEMPFTLQCVSETPFAIKVLTQGQTTSNPFGNTV